MGEATRNNVYWITIIVGVDILWGIHQPVFAATYSDSYWSTWDSVLTAKYSTRVKWGVIQP